MTMVGERIEFKNVKKDINQVGLVKDKIDFKEQKEDISTVTGYLVEEEESKTLRIVKASRVIRIL